jgi:diguanylate cyclase (GGDEF)-like protein/PAS domain S-box-containing protein
VALGYTEAGLGPLAALEIPAREQFLLVKFCVAATVFTVLPVALAVLNQQRIAARLKTSEARYRMLAENTSDIVVHMDLDLNRTSISTVSHDVPGLLPDILLGRKSLDSIHPDDRAAIEATVRRLQSGAARDETVYRLQRGDGQYVWYETVCKVVIDPVTGAHTGYLATVRDISARKSTETELVQTKLQLESTAVLDGLTGIPNRRSFDATLIKEWNRAARAREPLTILLCDVDNLQSLNERYGHLDGDEALRQIAQAARNTVLRPADFVARHGGEEFAVILPNTDAAGAMVVAERMRTEIRNLRIRHEGNPTGFVTVCMGLASTTPLPGADAVALVKRTQSALRMPRRWRRIPSAPPTAPPCPTHRRRPGSPPTAEDQSGQRRWNQNQRSGRSAIQDSRYAWMRSMVARRSASRSPVSSGMKAG